jgi:hypothetical protein
LLLQLLKLRRLHAAIAAEAVRDACPSAIVTRWCEATLLLLLLLLLEAS